MVKRGPSRLGQGREEGKKDVSSNAIAMMGDRIVISSCREGGEGGGNKVSLPKVRRRTLHRDNTRETKRKREETGNVLISLNKHVGGGGGGWPTAFRSGGKKSLAAGNDGSEN